MSRLNAVWLSMRWCKHQARKTVSVSSAVRPSAGPTSSAILRADLRVVAATSLGDVVQQHRQVQRAPRLQMLDQFRGDRRDLRQFAALHGVQHADRFDRVLIDGEDVIGVELHLPDDARPVGDESGRGTRSRSNTDSQRRAVGMRARRVSAAVVLGLAAAHQSM